jgi:asparagine synthetase A
LDEAAILDEKEKWHKNLVEVVVPKLIGGGSPKDNVLVFNLHKKGTEE